MEEEKGICPVCGKEFKKSRKSHIYCCKQCANNANQKKFREKEKKLGKEKITHIKNSKKTCAYCGKKYYGKRHSKYCSESCRRAMQFKKDIEKEKTKEKDRYKRTNKDEQLCCNCKNFCFGCSWSEEFKPVKGWKAIPTKIKHSSRKKLKDGKEEVVVKYDKSYKIIDCPKYEKG